MSYPTKTRNIRFKEGTLSKIEREQIKAQKAEEKAKAAMLRKAEERECKSEADFVRLAEGRGYDFPRQWARRKIAQRGAWRGR